VTFLQIEVEHGLEIEVEHGLEIEVTSLVASQLVPYSSKGKI
jgi:hypothetical protein